MEQESLNWEVKAARGGLPNAIWETISAFANTQGGWIVLGIAERGDQMAIEGVADPESMMRQLHDQMRNSSKISYPSCGANDVSILEADDKRVVALRVPPVPRRFRPVYIRGNPYNGTYLRRNEGDYPASRPEVDRMMREASGLASDQVILDGYSSADLDGKTIQGYRRRFQNALPDSPHNALGDEDFLAVIGGIRRERETGRRGITVAGLLMFGKDEGLRSWRGRHLIDYRLVTGDPTTRAQTDWTDRVPWEGNLLGAYDAIYRRLVDGLRIPFQFVDGVRVDQSEQHIAIREAFVNLLLHADYSEQAASLAFRSDEGYFFRNPGSSRVADLDSSLGDRSDPRNPDLVRMFRLIGLAEEAGSGVPRIVQAWRRLGYESPLFDLGGDRNEFSAELRFTHLLSAGDRTWLEALVWPLSEEEKLALVFARHEGWVDNGTLRRVTGQHPVDVTRMLGSLRDSGLLQMIGGGRGARYQLDPAVVLLIEEVEDASKNTRPQLDQQEAVLRSIDSPRSSAGSKTSTTDFASNSADLETSTADSPRTLIDDPIWRKLEDIALPVSSVDYGSAERRNEIVVRLCEVTSLSLLELVWLLRRNKAYVRSILKSLIKTGELEYIYPGKPRHPQQRYRTRHDG